MKNVQLRCKPGTIMATFIQGRFSRIKSLESLFTWKKCGLESVSLASFSFFLMIWSLQKHCFSYFFLSLRQKQIYCFGILRYFTVILSVLKGMTTHCIRELPNILMKTTWNVESLIKSYHLHICTSSSFYDWCWHCSLRGSSVFRFLLFLPSNVTFAL